MSKERPMVPDSSINDSTKGKEQLEESRETVDLRTFIHSNAVDVATSAELKDEKIMGDEVINNLPKVATGGSVVYTPFGGGGEFVLLFRSKEGSIKKVGIGMDKMNKIDELKEEYKNCLGRGDKIAELINSKLETLGFVCYDINDDGARCLLGAFSRILTYRKKEAQKGQGQGFEF